MNLQNTPDLQGYVNVVLEQRFEGVKELAMQISWEKVY